MAIPLQFEPTSPAGAGDVDRLFAGASGLTRTLLDQMPARVIVLDGEEHIAYVNHEFLVFTGLHPKQVLGRHIAQVIGADTYDTYAPARERLYRGESVCWEGWTELSGRGRRFMREHLVPVDAAPQRPPRAIVVMSRDLTGLKEREADLQAQVQRLEATEALKSSIVDNALAAIVSTDAAGFVVEFNPAAERMFGLARAATIGRRIGELIVPPRHRAAHEAGIARLSAGLPARILGRRIEMQALRADGSEFPIEMVLWRTEVDGVTHYTSSMFDLTERLKAAAEIERQRDALRQSEKLTAMGSLLAGVAHELNNPLAIVMGRASLLEAKCDDAELLADATRIREAAERCGRIVRTFLAMARKKPAAHTPVQLNDLVRGAIDLLSYNLRSSGIEVDRRLDPALPTAPADADQIGQIVLNLLVNAQQALAQIELPRRILLATGTTAIDDDERARVWLRVADNGFGVAAENRGTIFEAYFTTKAEGVGTGLGLAVSRSVASEHGGELLLEERSPYGRGASFRLELPLRGQPAVATVSEPARSVEADGGTQRVLVVDDEAEVSGLMRDVLEQAAFDVAEAESGAVALELLDAARFDAIVSDLRMPDMDGVALWNAVRKKHPVLASRVVFVTGDTLSAAAAEFMRRTGCVCVDKPFVPAELVAQVQAAVKRRAAD
jgi:two-component system NtrC family sensor kinase